jgi:molecular chaperone GrpE
VEEVKEEVKPQKKEKKVITKNNYEDNKRIKELEASLEDITNKFNEATGYVKELKDACMRSQAELVNYRKRKDEETSNLLKYANQDLVVDLVPVLDNLERAVNTDESQLDEKSKKYLQGFKLLCTNFKDTLKKYGVEEIPAVGVEFDPMIHEALMTKSDPTKKEDEVLECLMRGYTLKGKVVRPSKVVVNKIE